MKQGYIIIRPTGPIEKVETDQAPPLSELQKMVGGYIEPVRVLFNNKPHLMIVNEQGLLEGLLLNYRATSIYHAASLQRGEIPDSPIVGTAVLFINLELD